MESMNVLPAGFRFHPTDEELINDYLKKKVSACGNPFVSIIADIDLYKYNPWDLPGKAYFGEKEWFFFSPRERKYPNGARPNRAAASGYWKATGTDKSILSRNSWCIGVKKALVFYEGRPPTGKKTNWMMYEYRLLDSNLNHHSHKQRGSTRLDEWVLCRIREKARPQEPVQRQEETQINVKRAVVYNDELAGFIGDEHVHNMTFVQENDWPLALDCQSYDPRMILDFEEGTNSSGNSTSYDDFDVQVNGDGTMNQNLEGMKRFLCLDGYDELATNKRFRSINYPTFIDNNYYTFQISPI